MRNKNTWFYVALTSVLLSIVSLFLPIVTYYSYTESELYKFNIVDFIMQNSVLTEQLIDAYVGPIFIIVNAETASNLALLAAIALALAIYGLVTLKAQRPNTMNFALTVIGLIGIMIPSIIVIVCVTFLGGYYPGFLSLGIAPILSPAAVIVSILAVIRRKNKVAEELRRELEYRGLIYKAGDLK